MEDELRARVASQAPGRATFLGFVNQSELPDVYGLADMFVMPSESEPWGLVLNEAMVAGLPPVVAAEVGAARDLITNGVTGYAFAGGRWDAMAAHVAALATSSELRARIGAAARARAERYSFDATVEGIVDALRSLSLLPHGAARAADTGEASHPSPEVTSAR